MKAQFVNENIDFQRGNDPRKTMGIGDRVARYVKKMEPWLRKIEEKAKEFGFVDNTKNSRKAWEGTYPRDFTREDEESADLVKSWVRKTGPPFKRRTARIMIVIRELSPYWENNDHHPNKEAKKYGVYYLLLSDSNHPIDSPGEGWTGFDVDEKLYKWTTDRPWEQLIKNKDVNESVNFERGRDPKASMGIGKAANPFVIEYAEQEVDDDGPITGPLPEDHDQNTWFEPCDDYEVFEILRNWKELIDGSYYFEGHMKDADENDLEIFHAPEFNDEWVEFRGKTYYIPDHKEYWDKIY